MRAPKSTGKDTHHPQVDWVGLGGLRVVSAFLLLSARFVLAHEGMLDRCTGPVMCESTLDMYNFSVLDKTHQKKEHFAWWSPNFNMHEGSTTPDFHVTHDLQNL